MRDPSTIATVPVEHLVGDELYVELRRVRAVIDATTERLEREHRDCEGAFCSCRIVAGEIVEKQKEFTKRERAICERILKGGK